MANPSSRWDRVPVYGVYLTADDQGATGTDTMVVTVPPASLRIKSGGTIYPGLRRTKT